MANVCKMHKLCRLEGRYTLFLPYHREEEGGTFVNIAANDTCGPVVGCRQNQ